VSRIKLSILLLGLISWSGCMSEASTQREVHFTGASGATLAGTLLLPAGGARAPALVLLAGSGPTDRNGNQPPTIITDLLKQIAQGLADQGIASLRFDKRGMYANAAEWPKDKTKWGDFCAWENFSGDAAAACRFLRQQEHIDPDRVGILGHSEGGLLALDAAQTLQSEGHAPAVLILVSTPGRPVEAIIAEQLKNLLAGQHATPQQTEYWLSENVRITRAIRETGQVPLTVPVLDGLLADFYPPYVGKFFHSEMALDPCKLAADFTGPVLIVTGSADTQVSLERDAKALDAALSGRQNDIHTLAVIPKASHNLKLVSTPTDAGIVGPIVPAAIEQLQQWVLAHLANH
jgi:acetyl esterase/lipase